MFFQELQGVDWAVGVFKCSTRGGRCGWFEGGEHGTEHPLGEVRAHGPLTLKV